MRLAPAIAVLLFCGCPSAVVRDDSPKHPTAVVETYVDNMGFKGLFASESTDTVWTRSNMRRTEDQFRFSGFFMKHMAGAQDDATIWRIDRGLQWKLDIPQKLYTQCPLHGCVGKAVRMKQPSTQQQQRPQERMQERKPTCPLTVTKNVFSVKATGETKTLNDFPTKQYLVDWTIVARDKAKRTVTSQVGVELWTTSETEPRIAAVRGVERKFENAMQVSRPRKEIDKAVPPQAMTMIAAQFLGRLTPAQRESLLAAGREVSKIHGFPISTKLEWRLDGDACGEEADQPAGAAPEPQERSSSLDVSHGLSNFLSSAGSAAAQKGAEHKAAEIQSRPVFGFLVEIKRMEVAAASDGLFVPPVDFKKKEN